MHTNVGVRLVRQGSRKFQIMYVLPEFPSWHQFSGKKLTFRVLRSSKLSWRFFFDPFAPRMRQASSVWFVNLRSRRLEPARRRPRYYSARTNAARWILQAWGNQYPHRSQQTNYKQQCDLWNSLDAEASNSKQSFNYFVKKLKLKTKVFASAF